MKRKVFCKNCMHAFSNFWGYTECWKFDREVDLARTHHTAVREKDALRFNCDNACIHFIRKSSFQFLKERLCKHTSVSYITGVGLECNRCMKHIIRKPA